MTLPPAKLNASFGPKGDQGVVAWRKGIWVAEESELEWMPTATTRSKVACASRRPSPFLRHVSRRHCQGVKESRLIEQARLSRSHARLPPAPFFWAGKDPRIRQAPPRCAPTCGFTPEAAPHLFPGLDVIPR